MKQSGNDKAPIFLFYWKVIAPDGLLPVPEYEFARGVGRKFRFDWAWPLYRIGVEVDGGQWLKNGGRHAGDGDREKLNLAASLRWLVFRFSPEMLKKNPAKCVQMVIKAIDDSV